MKNTRIARRYAVALMNTAEELGEAEEIAGNMAAIDRLFRESREFRLLIASPVISAAKKKETLRALLETRVNRETLSFLLLLASKRREDVLPDIVREFLALRNQRMGIVEAQVKSAVPLTEMQEHTLRERLEQYTKKNVRLRLEIDLSLKGGLRIQIGDTVLDASVRHQLLLLKERFVSGGMFS